jgi:methylated-DNA-[protein]-cysteine S-methyltransferase
MTSTYYKSPLGYILLIAEEKGLREIRFLNENKNNCKENNSNFILNQAIYELNEYFYGNRKIFTVPTIVEGTQFQKKVWDELKKIPYGETRTYKELAINISNKNASRAVGNANNKNKIPIIIPCHRVIGSNNKLVGYAAGLWRKELLLKIEGKN